MTDFSASDIIEVEKPKRPLGIWFLTIFMGIFSGIVPMGLSLFLFFNQTVQSEMGLTFSTLILPLILGSAVIVTAFGAWQGNNKARMAFLVAITIHYLFLIYQNYQIYQLANEGLVASSLGPRSCGRIFRSVFWVALSWLYLNGKQAKSFYAPSTKVVGNDD